MTELYQKYRPSEFKGLVGQPAAVQILTKMVKDGVPHAVLMQGPSGTGKTSAARVLARELDSEGPDCQELNCADVRGIDAVRGITQEYTTYAMKPGGNRVYIIDECFAPHTPVLTDDGPKRIDSVCVGDRVLNVSGGGVVENVFVNKVSLDRLVKLTFKNGSVLFTTLQHEFLTTEGWVEAQGLRFDHCILCVIGYPVPEEGSRHVSVCRLSETVQPQEAVSGMLLQTVFDEEKNASVGLRTVGGSELFRVSKGLHLPGQQPEDFLHNELCLQAAEQEGLLQTQALHAGRRRQVERISHEVLRHPTRQRAGSTGVRQDAGDGPSLPTDLSQKYDEDQGTQWDVTRRSESQGRQRQAYLSAGTIVGGAWTGLEDGAGDTYEASAGEWLPDVLQSGRGQQGIEDRGGDRWQRAQDTEGEGQGCQKRSLVGGTGLVSVEVYEQGRNDTTFLGVVTDQDRSRGYVEFYDLQVSGMPSYFANGVAVHNCQKLTNDAQNALLKPLEDPPAHVYWILCASEPSKLLPTVRSRCTKVEFKAIGPADMTKLLKDVVKKSKLTCTSDDLFAGIVETSQGNAREALTLLENALRLDSVKDQIAYVSRQVATDMVEKLCKELLEDQPDWSRLCGFLSATGDEVDAEGVRRRVLAYMSACLMRKANPRAAKTMHAFREPLYDAGTAKQLLTLYCFDATYRK